MKQQNIVHFVLLSLQLHEASTMDGLKNFQILCKHALCEHSHIALCSVAQLRGSGPPLAALLWGRHHGLCCKL